MTNTLYTKRQYLADCAANSIKQADVVSKLASFNDRLETGEQLTADWSDEWNNAYDAAYQLEQERADIEAAAARVNARRVEQGLPTLEEEEEFS